MNQSINQSMNQSESFHFTQNAAKAKLYQQSKQYKTSSKKFQYIRQFLTLVKK